MRVISQLNHNLHHTLDLIRGVAVLLVFFSHLDNFKIFVIWPLSYQPIGTSIGGLGVDLFFLLSGYLIWASAKQTLDQPHGLLRYAINRVTRIYPLYLFCIFTLVITAEYFIGLKKPDISFEVIARHLLFLQSFEPNVSGKLNGPFWSLTHEFLFYLLVPVLYFLKPSYRLLLLSIVVTQALVMFFTGLHGFVHFWCLFAIGILIQQSQKTLASWMGLALLAILLGVVFIDYQTVKALEFPFAILLFSTLLNFQLKHFIFKPLRALGVVSYSVYVWHYVLIHLISPYIKNVHVLMMPIKPWLPFGFALEAFYLIVFILLFSTVSYWLIEKPSMTLLRKRLTHFSTVHSKG